MAEGFGLPSVEMLKWPKVFNVWTAEFDEFPTKTQRAQGPRRPNRVRSDFGRLFYLVQTCTKLNKSCTSIGSELVPAISEADQPIKRKDRQEREGQEPP